MICRREQWIRGAGAGIGPIIVTLDTEYPGADLVVATNLATGQPAVDILAAVRKALVRPILLGPQATDIAADIASGPTEGRGHHRRLGIDWCARRPHVRRHRR